MRRAQKYSAAVAVVVALSAKWVVPFAEKLAIIASVAIKQGFWHLKEIALIKTYLEISVMIVNDNFGTFVIGVVTWLGVKCLHHI